ncbi:MAG: hypothetical protein PF636_07020 [Actinomycetota bacterium]|jgi:hypothetical protein|nr:hypothetical protein [Actinomycetota bacterium]
MILGFDLEWQHILLGGMTTGILLTLQVLVGARIIKFKGRTHMKVHKLGGWVLLGFGLMHMLLALAVYNDWSILS